MADRITIEPFGRDQLQIKFYGRRVGYCGVKPSMPINFLTDCKNPHGPQCGLTADERREVIAAVIALNGGAMKTRQTERFWPEPVTNEVETT